MTRNNPPGDPQGGHQRPPKSRWPIFVAFSCLGLVAIICIGLAISLIVLQTQTDLVDQMTALLRPETALTPARYEYDGIDINQIAFVGNDHNIWLVSPDGRDLRPLTDDGSAEFGYQFPTWAPDSRHIAFVGPTSARDLALFVSPSETLAPNVIFQSATADPFYLYWSPNSEEITFLTQEQSGLAMRLANIMSGQESRILEKGSPFYWTWSPGSDRLLMHVGGSRAFTPEAHLSLLDNQADATRIELPPAPGRFQAPIWAPDGQHLFYVAESSQGEDAIFQMEVGSQEEYPIADLRGLGVTYMVISPDGRHVAYLESDGTRPVPLGSPMLVNLTETEVPRLITNRSVMSMYWSPDGEKLALLTADTGDGEPSAKRSGLAAPLPQRVQFRWWVYHLSDGTLTALQTIEPTFDFFQTIPYFDQYHLSLTFWSPDSRNLVITSGIDDQQNGEVLVLDVTGQAPSRKIGMGRLAVWSWR